MHRRIDPDIYHLPAGQGGAIADRFPASPSVQAPSAFLLPPTSQLPVGLIVEQPISGVSGEETAYTEEPGGFEGITQAGPAIHPERGTVSKPSVPTLEHIATKAESSQAQNKSEPFQPPVPSKQAITEPSTNEPDESDPSWPRLQTILRKHREKQISEPPNPVEEPELESDTSYEEIAQRGQFDTEPVAPMRQPTEDPSSVQLKPLNKEPIRHGEEGEAPAELPTSLHPIESSLDAQPTELDETGTNPSESQVIPLQDAWSVQREEKSLEIPPPMTPTPPRPVAATPRHESMGKVDASHRSESSIDFVPPRRSRPEKTQPVFQKGHTEPGMESIEQQPADTAPVGAQTVQSDPVTDPPNESPEVKKEIASTGLQRKQDRTTPSEKASVQEMIPTEIGPLPGDLWEILGQSPPTGSAGEDRSTEFSSAPKAPLNLEDSPAQSKADISHPASFKTRVNKEEAKSRYSQRESERRTEIEPSISPKSDHGPFQHRASMDADSTLGSPPLHNSVTNETSDALVQRQPSSRDALPDSADISTEEPVLDTMVEPPPSEQLDEHELARRVYAEIRRRLSIEWERVRRMV